MFVTKKHIPRRTFLRGAGVTLALPLLESMLPALTPTRLTAAAPVRRFAGIWHPHGAAPGYWSPTKEGRNFDFSFITKPLEPFRDRTVLITGLDMPEAMATDEEPGGDHARGAVLLSGARPRRNAVAPFLGETIDQTIAKMYGQDTILQSLQLGVEDTGNFGNCNWGYSCAYTNSISWSSATQPLRPFASVTWRQARSGGIVSCALSCGWISFVACAEVATATPGDRLFVESYVLTT